MNAYVPFSFALVAIACFIHYAVYNHRAIFSDNFSLLRIGISFISILALYLPAWYWYAVPLGVLSTCLVPVFLIESIGFVSHRLRYSSYN